MLKQMKESENEIETLRQYIIDLKSRIAVYIPVKNDPVDKKLAEYINNYPDRQKLKIMFMRESDGVYQFGSKRVRVMCVRDKIQIQVGGGYLSLDEFLDQYTPTELQVLERKDPMRRMTDRIALQKTLQGRSADSPNASPTRSPVRAAKKKVAV
uniref:GAR domain-containing protein n=1 Tax=Favella ehrenbergii TaxID=182087 RepID=A0A7S3HXI5_9SPIT|mmetsp:Transcript_33386/g.43987  ORF Transcript_33386/g.43987 Transcript_33386/m.43987 type:complete len:154 (+) Transcript_33386:862-1323(+)